MARKNLKVEDSSDKLQPLVEADTTRWSSLLSSTQPPPRIFYSALAASHTQAGNWADNQRKVDYDLNIELAKTAQVAGAEVYVLISSTAISPNSLFRYCRLKAEIEEAVKVLEFKHVVLVKPGLIVGPREDSRPIESLFRGLANGLGSISGGALKNFWAQDVDVIAKAAVSAGIKCLDGQAPHGKVWEVQQADILRLGHTEWKGHQAEKW